MLKGTVLLPLFQHPPADLSIRLIASDMQSTQHKVSLVKIASTALLILPHLSVAAAVERTTVKSPL